jgi:hypothetical protein
MNSTVDESSDDEVAIFCSLALAVRDGHTRISKTVEYHHASRKKHGVVTLKGKLGSSMRVLQKTQDFVVKLRNENAELRAIINDLQKEIGI